MREFSHTRIQVVNSAAQRCTPAVLGNNAELMKTSPNRPERTARPLKPSVSADRETMGARLRAIRKSHQLTLKQLSSSSGVALSTLSKMELGQVSIGYEKFGAVARALGIDISSLFEPAKPNGRVTRPTFVRSDAKGHSSYASDQYDYRVLAVGYPHKSMTPILTRIIARAVADFADFVRHGGEEFVLVISGAVRIEFETGESTKLARGESVYFDSSVGHVYLSTSRADAEVLLVMTSEGTHGSSPPGLVSTSDTR